VFISDRKGRLGSEWVFADWECILVIEWAWLRSRVCLSRLKCSFGRILKCATCVVHHTYVHTCIHTTYIHIIVTFPRWSIMSLKSKCCSVWGMLLDNTPRNQPHLLSSQPIPLCAIQVENYGNIINTLTHACMHTYIFVAWYHTSSKVPLGQQMGYWHS